MKIPTKSCRSHTRKRFRVEAIGVDAEGILVAAMIIVLASGFSARAADVKRLTMAEAVDLALRQNRNLKIARLGIEEAQEKKASAKSQYFPALSSRSGLSQITELQNIDIPAGSFGRTPGVGGLPQRPLSIDQGKKTLVISGTDQVHTRGDGFCQVRLSGWSPLFGSQLRHLRRHHGV